MFHWITIIDHLISILLYYIYIYITITLLLSIAELNWMPKLF